MAETKKTVDPNEQARIDARKAEVEREKAAQHGPVVRTTDEKGKVTERKL